MSNIKILLPETKFVPAVVGFIVKEDQVLLGLRKKVSFGLGKNLICGIGGKVEEGEKWEEALKREFMEEVEIGVLSYTLVAEIKFIFPHKPKWCQDVKAYLIDSWEGKPKETDVIKPDWFSQGNLPENQMWTDNLFWVPRILKGEKIKAIFLYDESGKVMEHKIEDLQV